MDRVQPAFILVRPQMGENIGAAARAMLNFGQERMRLVAPRDGWPNPKAVAMASGAGRVLDGASLHDDVAGAIADCHYVYATTARVRGLTKPVLSPEEAMAEARAMMAEGKRIGLMFGPERAGLENEDVALANAIVTVPVNPDFPSLNLGQCVLLVAYELARLGAVPDRARGMAGTDFAEAIEVEKLGDRFDAALEEAGYFFPPEKAPGMRVNLRNMWARLDLTRADVQMLHGMLRQILRRLPGPGAR